MKSSWDRILNLFLLTLVFLIAAGFETTVWPQIFGTLAAPMAWLCIVVYITLYRKPAKSILLLYFISFLMMGFTLTPLKMILLPLVILFFIINSIKSRVFWSGPSYYVLMSSAAVVMFHISYMIISHWLEKNPSAVEWGSRLLMVLITPLISYPIYAVLTFIDKWTHSEHLNESGGIEL